MILNSKVRVRIAPSPTGPLHIGTARTALFNYLFAKKRGGSFVLRIEDTDLERSDPKYELDILEGLRWLGIEWDEGPGIKNQEYNILNAKYSGDYGPYRQSERVATYKKYAEKLLAEGKAFYCFHSEKELEEEKAKLLEAKRPPLHFCEYRTLDPKEAETLTETKEDYIIRFKTPAGRKITFTDLIRGEVSFDSDFLGDFSIAKRMDIPLYNFAVVVDDEEMKISHVIRGEDHISNTPKQLLLIEALEFSVPQYAHLPLILGPDRSKLSKRHGATSVGGYREEGYLSEALVNFMALLGWNPGGDRELFTMDELIREFSLDKIQKSGAVFDVKKLDWMNGEYIRKKSVKDLTKLCIPYLADFLKFSIPNDQFSIDYIEKIVELEQPRFKKLSELPEKVDYFFKDPEYDKELLRWKNMSDEEILATLDKSIEIISDIVFKNYADSKRSLETCIISKEVLEEKFLEESGEGDKGKLLWPLRVALTGKRASPGPFEIIEILGMEETKRRLAAAKEKLRG